MPSDEIKRKTSEPELRKFNLFTVLDDEIESKDDVGFDNLAMYNGGSGMDGNLRGCNFVRQISQTYTDVDYNSPTKYSSALKMLKPFRPSSKDGKMPVNKAGLLSYTFMMWMTSLMMKMYKHKDEELKEDDIWECSDMETSKRNTDRLETIWNKELKLRGQEKSSFLRCWLKFSSSRTIACLVVVILNAVSTFMSSGYLIYLLIAYLETADNNLIYGICLVVAMAVSGVIRAGTFSVIMVFGAQTGVRFRAGFLGLAYRKMLKLPKLKGKDLAEVVNIFGGDSQRVYINCQTFVYLLALPVYMVIATIYSYYLIGPWCFIAIGIFVICYIIQIFVTMGLQFMRRKTVKHTDKRDWNLLPERIKSIPDLQDLKKGKYPLKCTSEDQVRKMTEVLNSMKLLKMYAWEEPFKKTISGIRKQEQKCLLISAILNSISAAIIPVFPTLASVVTIAVYSSFGNSISASQAFAVVGTLYFLKVIIALIPFASRMFGEVLVSFGRIKKLLVQEEYEPHNTKCQNKNNAMEIENAVFMWEDESISEKTDKKKTDIRENRESNTSFHIEGINFTIKRGSLIGVCGPVGLGKSSLIAAILARMPFISGHVAVNGTIAYAAQQAWIFNDTVRENILFGKSYDPERYRDVIYVCGLEPDLAILDNGDETEIGERGANLSGGQKQRVSLARAVYSDSDIYLLDDPLSAVDVHVGRHLFHKCIRKTLASKTVILTTHQLQYLKHCDEIVAVEDGGIVERGHHDELMMANGYYKSLMDKFHYSTNPSIEQQLPIPSQSDRRESTEAMPNGEKADEEKSNQKSSYDEAPDIEQNEKGKLVEREDMAIGKVKFGTYKSYISAAGGVIVCFLVIMSYVVTMGSVVFTDWWLGIWINTLEMMSVNITEGVGNYAILSNVSVKAMHTDNVSYTHDTFPTEQPYERNNGIDFYLLVYVSSLGAVILLTLLKGVAGAKATIQASVTLHNRVLKIVMGAPMQFFYANPIGRILNRFSKDMDEADVFLPQLIDVFLQVLCTIVLSLLSTAIVLPWTLVVMVPVAILFYILKNISATSIMQLKRVENVSRSPVLSNVNTTAQGLFTIVPFQQQKKFMDSSMKFIDVMTTATFLFECSMRWVIVRLDLTSAMITAATALIIVITKGSVSPAMAGLSITMCIKVVGPMQFMVFLMNEIQARFTSIERLHHYETKLEKEVDIFNTTPSDNWPNEGRIIFAKAEMRYRANMRPVLKNITFDIHPQMKIGIVGRTGAGKSSLAAALFRLVELSNGHIYIDGIDVSQVALKLLRSRLSTIPQDPVLFAGTLRYNLDPFGKYSDAQLWDSLESVHIKEKVVQFDQGLDYEVEENGENFSVGERQLICLARAILRKNKILLLDEATGSIDTKTDSLIQQTIKDRFAECTVLTIAHRLNTVVHSDLIIILDNGEVIEIGAPQDLMSNPYSFFNAMVAAQTVKTPSP